MNPIRIPITLSPHFVNDKPQGYYVLAKSLFPRGAPDLIRRQWIGFANNCLVITVDHPHEWDSLLKMTLRCSLLSTAVTSWLAPAKLWQMPKGFRTYIPGSILKPQSAEATKVETMGTFRQCNDIFYLEISAIDGEILLGRKELK